MSVAIRYMLAARMMVIPPTNIAFSTLGFTGLPFRRACTPSAIIRYPSWGGIGSRLVAANPRFRVARITSHPRRPVRSMVCPIWYGPMTGPDTISPRLSWFHILLLNMFPTALVYVFAMVVILMPMA